MKCFNSVNWQKLGYGNQWNMYVGACYITKPINAASLACARYAGPVPLHDFVLSLRSFCTKSFPLNWPIIGTLWGCADFFDGPSLKISSERASQFLKSSLCVQAIRLNCFCLGQVVWKVSNSSAERVCQVSQSFSVLAVSLNQKCPAGC